MELDWTPEAEETLSAFFKRHWKSLCPEGADVIEVQENIRQHVHEEASTAGANLITAERLNQSLAGLIPDDLEPEAGGGAIPSPPPQPAKKPAFLQQRSHLEQAGTKALSAGYFMFGIFLPILTICIEVIGHSCASVLFNPIPSVWNLLLITLVPVVHIIVFRLSCGTIKQRPRLYPFLCGAAIVIGLYYTLLFIPVTPIAIVGIVYFGFGLIPLTPLCALLVSVRSGFKLSRMSRAAGHSPKLAGRNLLLGAAASCLALAAVEGPKYITREALLLVSSDNPETQTAGINMLRNFGSKKALLRACYESRGRFSGSFDTAGWAYSFATRSTGSDDARRAYFQVTGKAFNHEKPPRMHSRFARSDFLDDFDFDQGGDAVGLRLSNLHLKSSRLDTHVDTDSALAYTEWTVVFKNERTDDAEARFQALLPPGGVVSRLTLWVNGEPQEAAFAASQEVRAAYQNVAIAQRRDPVLVTSTGPDRVLVQCFPILPDGEMKVRLGITAPLVQVASDTDTGRTWMPRIVERNFNLSPGHRHSVWVQSRGSLSSPLRSLSTEKGSGDRAHGLNGSVTNADIESDGASISAGGIDFSAQVWAEDPFDSDRAVILRKSAPPERARHDHLVVVLDTSAGMADGWERTKDIIAAAARKHPMTLVLADDEITTHSGGDAITDELRGLKARGGKDNASALLQGLSLARQHKLGAVVWVHGPQPVLLADREQISQSLERSFTSRPIYRFTEQEGIDFVTAALYKLADMRAAPRGAKLETFLDQLASAGVVSAIPAHQYERLAANDEAPEGATKVWDHLARYWAFTETMRQYHQREKPGIAPAAAALGAKYQLVTPFSGAVVLETKQDYAAAGLEQVDPTTTPHIPGIPEPSGTALLLLALSAIALRRRR